MTESTDLLRASRRRAVRTAPTASASPAGSPRPVPPVRWSRRRGVLGVFAAIAAVGFAGAYVIPTTAAIAEVSPAESTDTTVFAEAQNGAQSITVEVVADDAELPRDGYEVYVKPKPKPKPAPVVTGNEASSSSSGWAPPVVAPDPGSAQAIAFDMVASRGWGENEFACLVALWNKESGWRVNAYNASSGAYGIPQALPGGKMASAGGDWQTNPATQIAWGLGYIGGRYGSPCGAWGHSQARGWY